MRGHRISVAVLVLTGTQVGAYAGRGQLLVEYQSAAGTLPSEQGWQHTGQCLLANCPTPRPATPSECYWQGSRGNDCTFSVGCHTAAAHYNSPPFAGVSGTCMFTEWITFDDGDNSNDRLIILDSHITHSPPWGAPGFIGAPTGHRAIRISGGDGNLVAESLPAGSGNDRNRGQVDINHGYTWAGTDGAVTVVARVAAGPFSPGKEFLKVQTPQARFGFFVNGQSGHANFGRIGFNNGSGENGYLFGPTRVAVAVPQRGVNGPHAGEFFTLRAICRNNGSFTAYLREQRSTKCSNSVAKFSGETTVRFGVIDLGDACVWIDYVQLFDGAVPPPGCSDPAFDINDDGLVNLADVTADLVIGDVHCATGPAPHAGVFQALPDNCKCLDVNGDQAIDVQDYGVFQRCLSGTRPANPACDDVP